MKSLFNRTSLTCICFLLAPVLRAQIVAGPLTNQMNGHLYYVLGQTMSWSNAQAEATSLGGNLATIRNVQENNWIVSNVLVDFTAGGGPNLTQQPLWMGLVDPTQNDGSQHAADFVWISGETNTYRNWESGEPNNNGNAEYWGTINWHYAAGFSGTPGTWNDTPLDGTTGYPGNSTGPYYGLMEIGSGSGLQLSIQPVGIQAVRVYWTAPVPTLQQSSDLANWTNTTLTVTSANGTNSVTLAPATGSLYFRLVVP